MRSKRRRRAAAVQPPSVSEHREVPSNKATLLRTQDSPKSQAAPTDLPPRQSELRPVRARSASYSPVCAAHGRHMPCARPSGHTSVHWVQGAWSAPQMLAQATVAAWGQAARTASSGAPDGRHPPAFSTRSRGRAAACVARDQLLPSLHLSRRAGINRNGTVPLVSRVLAVIRARTRREARA